MKIIITSPHERGEIKKVMTKLFHNYYWRRYTSNYHPDILFDRRTTIGKRQSKIAREIIKIPEFEVAFSKHLSRQKNYKYTRGISKRYAPYSENKLYVDWKNNKPFLTYINDRLLKFGWRNHWAKTDIDTKLLRWIMTKVKKECLIFKR